MYTQIPSWSKLLVSALAVVTSLPFVVNAAKPAHNLGQTLVIGDTSSPSEEYSKFFETLKGEYIVKMYLFKL